MPFADPIIGLNAVPSFHFGEVANMTAYTQVRYNILCQHVDDHTDQLFIFHTIYRILVSKRKRTNLEVTALLNFTKFWNRYSMSSCEEVMQRKLKVNPVRTT